MTDDKSDDDSYVIEDTGESIEDIEHEMELAAQEAAGAVPEPPAAAEPSGNEMRDRYLRTLADFENYRKRADRESGWPWVRRLLRSSTLILPDGGPCSRIRTTMPKRRPGF